MGIDLAHLDAVLPSIRNINEQCAAFCSSTPGKKEKQKNQPKKPHHKHQKNPTSIRECLTICLYQRTARPKHSTLFETEGPLLAVIISCGNGG